MSESSPTFRLLLSPLVEFTVQCKRTGMDTSLVQVSIKHSGAAKAGGKFKIVGVYSC